MPNADISRALVLERTIAAPRNAVWRCWTEPELLRQWLCPKPWFVSEVRMDTRPGGEFFTVMNGPDGERHDNPGQFVAVEAERRLVTTDAFIGDWQPSQRPFMVAEMLFEDLPDGGTAYTAIARHWSDDDRKQHEAMGFHEGWGMAATQLETLARSLEDRP